ncbi:GIY-YIG nuclease family protein (plasmid) [Paracoccus sp. Arc7-R13]|uniref:GIY-YIG nuclease family protein n=1 Tax=Paracoccus sp. Arc7-R13 TaxID=2500532 RepID=UPI000FDB73AF|nr:GIY-YIG nuclease family protein [Paracoccus sp. Arc7-R13]AZY95824.1 GIY-YIG nuclease family protein [Paracoccus sp. Arc7-R13]
MAKTFTDEDDALLADLGIEIETRKHVDRTPREERIIAGFEEIQQFVTKNGRAPQHGEDRDIFERLYAVRLDRIRDQTECRELVAPLDSQELLSGAYLEAIGPDLDTLDDDALLAELGVEVAAPAITELTHVRSTAEKKAADEIAAREKCDDFAAFKPLFEKVQKELDSKLRETRTFEMKAEIEKGRFFIVGGQKAYVAEKGETITNDQGRTDARLRVIFDNGTESSMLMRSLQRALNKDEAGRRITEPSAGPLFSDQTMDGDEASGTIYVLRSKSEHPLVAANRELIHKIGVTNLSVEKRIAGAHLQPTFLMANVEVVATYELYNINRTKLEKLIHRIFEPARLNIDIMDRFGRPVTPREWFMVPMYAIKDAVEKIKEGTISGFVYDPKQAQLTKI